jgi:hypothetical protein
VKDEKVSIGMRVGGLEGPAPKVLEGDVTKWPGAFIIFRVKIDPATPMSATHIGK